MRNPTKRRLHRYEKTGSRHPLGYVSFDSGTLRRAGLMHARSFPYLVRMVHANRNEHDDGYRQKNPYRLHEHRSIRGLREEASKALADLVDDLPDTRPFVDAVADHLKILADLGTPIDDVLAEYRKMLDTLSGQVDAFAPPDSGQCRVAVSGCRVVAEFSAPASERLDGHGAAGELSAQDFIVQVSGLCQTQRRARRRPTPDEAVVTHLGYVLLARGVRVPLPPRPWRSPGFREVQTYMSVTDPYEGHVLGTTSDERYLKGVIVHVEYLERESGQDRKTTEAYRIPAPLNLARVRLHVGVDAPCSSYVGRPVFEADFASSLLKTVHTIAAACAEIFSNGFTECKVAIENMSASQAVELMQAIDANVARDPHLQVISAAFCLNEPILDDRPATLAANDGRPHHVAERFQIGLLGLELAAAGGVDKVTWDGAADTYPSTCVLEQLTLAEAMTLVHRAHEKGLLTYFSGGFRLHHLSAAVFTGADGIGVGGAQILRFMDPTNGHHGPFKAENITKILAARDEAAGRTMGIGAQTLARLDQLFFERSITPGDDALRRQLFDALITQDEVKVADLVGRLSHVRQLAPETEHPVMASAKRILAAGGSSLAARAYVPDEWHLRARRLATHLEAAEYDQLAEELQAIRHHAGLTSLPIAGREITGPERVGDVVASRP